MALHPEGRFDGTVLEHGFTDPALITAERPQQYVVRLRTVDNGVEYTITKWLSLSENARKWTAKQLRACGWDGDPNHLEHDELVGAQVSYTVEHETKENKVRAVVGWINAPGSIKRGEATHESKQRLAAALAALGEPNDDDVPF